MINTGKGHIYELKIFRVFYGELGQRHICQHHDICVLNLLSLHVFIRISVVLNELMTHFDQLFNMFLHYGFGNSQAFKQNYFHFYNPPAKFIYEYYNT